jgi:hypothetical protein
VTRKLATIDVGNSRPPWKRMVPSKSLLTAAGKKGNLFGRPAVFRAISAEQKEPLHQRNLEMILAKALGS